MPNTIVIKKVSELVEWDKNPRSIDKKRFEELVSDIKNQGFLDVLKLAADGKTVIGGNHRLKALQTLGIAEVNCIVTQAKTDKEMFLRAVRDNEEFAYWNDQDVAELAITLDVEPLELERYEINLGKPTKLGDLTNKYGPEPKEDEPPEVDKTETISKLGEIYQLGRHRVMCADSTVRENVEMLMNGEKADMVFTDPPYALFGNSTGVAGVADDKMIRPFFDAIFRSCRVVTKLFGHLYVCCDWHSAFVLQEMARNNGWRERNLCIWDKGDGGVGAFYQNCYEMVWLYSNSPQAKTTGTKQKGERTINGKPNIWRHNRANNDRQHNAQKPTEMVVNAINASSEKGELVVDLFLGSGSTLIACEQTDRTCYGMELDPKYVDVIRKRYAKFIDPDSWEEKWQEMSPPVK